MQEKIIQRELKFSKITFNPHPCGPQNLIHPFFEVLLFKNLLRVEQLKNVYREYK